MTISPNARTVWRNYVTDGIPSSGVHKVSKADIRTWGTAVETVLNAFTTNGGLIYSTMSAMNAAASTFTEPRSAWQFETGYEGVYALNPSTDTWTKVGRLPYDFVIGTDVGTGTANAIQITTDIPVADGMIVAFSLFEATTSSPVTVAINAGAALTLKTNRGGNASALTSGMEIWGRYRASDSTFRMLNDQDVSTLVAQAEAARDAAVAAAASVNLPAVLTPLTIPVTNAAGTLREDLTAPEVKTFLNVENTTRAFATAAALLLAVVAEDHISIADVPMVADASGTFLDSTGKKFKPAFWVTPKLYGAAGDGTTDDVTALRACWDAAGLYRVPVLMEGKEYNCSDSVFTSSNLTVHGQGAVMYITAWPSVGGFINNVRPIAAERAQSNIRFYDLVTDGSKLPTPTAGQNCNLGPEFVRGASDIIVQGCTARYIREGSGGGPGGAGFGGEVGIKDAHFINCIAHDCYRGYRVAGKSGTNDDGSERWCLNVTFKDCSAIRCGAATFCHAVGEPGDYTASNLAIFEAVFDGLYVEDCGHQGWFAFPFDDYPTVVAQKSGVFTFAGAQNIRMRGLRVKINSTYPASFTDWLGRTGWPAGGTGLLGSGLSGNVGALFLGHGRNIVVDDCTIDGITDVMWKCARAQAMGDWASVPPTGSNVAQNVFNIRQVRSGGYLYVFDGGDVGANLMAALSSSVIRLTRPITPRRALSERTEQLASPPFASSLYQMMGKYRAARPTSGRLWGMQGRPVRNRRISSEGLIWLVGTARPAQSLACPTIQPMVCLGRLRTPRRRSSTRGTTTRTAWLALSKRAPPRRRSPRLPMKLSRTSSVNTTGKRLSASSRPTLSATSPGRPPVNTRLVGERKPLMPCSLTLPQRVGGLMQIGSRARKERKAQRICLGASIWASERPTSGRRSLA